MRRPTHRFLHALALAALCSLPVWLAEPVQAAPVPAQSEADDPPGRVGRLSEVQGQVWLFHPQEGEWIAAERNRPLTTGDRLASDGGARAEVQVGSTTLRLDSGTEIEVLRLDDERIALQLHGGSLAVRLRSREAVPEFELRTDEGRFTVQRTGRYRFDRADEASFVTVLSGQALYEGPGSALTVNAGQRAEFWFERGNAAQYSILEPERDAFASWSAARDRNDDRSAATRYVSPEMTGVEDLDRYGYWEQNPEYGSLWIPRGVAPGWAPYSTGRWAWVHPWGWTWVDDAPWGFAPFHYGRWVYVGTNWCWSPGTYVRRPVYAPALVAWIGGPRLQVGITIGGGPAVGWVPLAPREVFVPGYRVSTGYVRNVNVTHVTNITNITTIINNPQQAVSERDYRNRKFPHAVTVVPASTLTTRQPVGQAAARWRDSPAVRELAREPPRSNVVVAPSVAPPPAQRRPDAPATRLPGFRPNQPDVLRAAPEAPREVRERERERDPRAGREGREPRDAPPQPARPGVPPQLTRPAPGAAAAPAAPEVRAPAVPAPAPTPARPPAVRPAPAPQAPPAVAPAPQAPPRPPVVAPPQRPPATPVPAVTPGAVMRGAPGQGFRPDRPDVVQKSTPEQRAREVEKERVDRNGRER